MPTFAMEHIVEATLGDELQDQHGHICMQTAPDETDQIRMLDPSLAGDLIRENLFVMLLTFSDKALHSNLLVVLGDPPVNLTEGTFPNPSVLTVVFRHLVQFIFAEDFDVHHLVQYVATIFVE